MSSWSKRRKTLYATVVAIFLIGAVVVPAFLIFYKAPTCSDGLMNGKERGVDCGGACQRLCQSDFLPPSLGWTRFEEVAPGLYNVAAYLVNPNTEGEARNVPYRLSLYDKRGVLITQDDGIVTLPPHRNTLAYQGAVNVGQRIPSKALFEFTGPPIWYKQIDTLSALNISDKKYTEEDTSSSLIVQVKNTSTYPVYNASVYAILYDADNNALGFSKTILDVVPAQGSTIAPFTWPMSRQGKVISIEVLPVVE